MHEQSLRSKQQHRAENGDFHFPTSSRSSITQSFPGMRGTRAVSCIFFVFCLVVQTAPNGKILTAESAESEAEKRSAQDKAAKSDARVLMGTKSHEAKAIVHSFYSSLPFVNLSRFLYTLCACLQLEGG